MHASQSHVHYAPSSVGALMDPAFLRGAVLDADGVRPQVEMAAAGKNPKDEQIGIEQHLMALR